MGKMVRVIAMGYLDADVFKKAADDGIFAKELSDHGLFCSWADADNEVRSLNDELEIRVGHRMVAFLEHDEVGLLDDEFVINTAIPHLRRCIVAQAEGRTKLD